MHARLMEEYESGTGASFKDSLTNLFNYGFFRISLDREVKRSERHGGKFTLALIDMDSFTFYNKRYGSVAGDRMLKEIAGIILKNIRQVDLAARYFGDVLALILPNSSAQQALAAAERIRKAVDRHFNGTSTVSLGLASYPQDASNSETLIERAQEALVQAKLRGKNKACFFEKKTEFAGDTSPRIMIVDDDPSNVRLLEEFLRPLNFEVIKAFNGEEALSLIHKVDMDLVLLDVIMPLMDGYEVCRRLKGSEATRLIPVIMITGLDDMKSKIRAIEAGADDFLNKPLDRMELLTRTKSLIKLRTLNKKLAGIEHILFTLANTVEAKDDYTQGHVERVSNLAVSLGRKMGLTPRELEALRFGAALHDIGKIGVKDGILNKPGPLDPDEFETIKAHADVGYNICLPLRENLGSALEVIRNHHEKLDGSGYPDGLRGDEISKEARIMAVVDIYDALVTDRPYRKGLSKEKAFAILRKEASAEKLDKEIVEYLAEKVA